MTDLEYYRPYSPLGERHYAPPGGLHRVRAALAEVGFPNPDIRGSDDEPNVALGSWADMGQVPDRIVWKAYSVAGFAVPCWECWNNHYGDDCLLDNVEDCGLDRS
jgi:hypothetical protein